MAKRYVDRQVRQILREIESGKKIVDVCRKFGVSRTTIYRWQKRRSGQPNSEAYQVPELNEGGEPSEQPPTCRYLDRLGAENTRLRRIVIRQALQIDSLEDLVAKMRES